MTSEMASLMRDLMKRRPENKRSALTWVDGWSVSVQTTTRTISGYIGLAFLAIILMDD